MKNLLHTWEFKWYGIWKEYGEDYNNLISIKDCIAPSTVQLYDLEKMRVYLSKCQVVASTSRSNFPNPFTNIITGGSISFRTDGEWLWLDDLPDYIEENQVGIPTAFFEKIKSNNYQPVSKWIGNFEKLDWPKL